MIVLDTNVVSELMRARPEPMVVRWLDAQVAEDCWLTSITVAELLYGVGRLPHGRRRAQLAELLQAMVDVDFAGRIAPFDVTAAAHYADVVIVRERAGRPISAADAQIAAIARSHDALLATRNIPDFDATGARLVDPWMAR